MTPTAAVVKAVPPTKPVGVNLPKVPSKPPKNPAPAPPPCPPPEPPAPPLPPPRGGIGRGGRLGVLLNSLFASLTAAAKS